MKDTHAIRFRHHKLDNGLVLTICTDLIYETREVFVGYSIYNPSNDMWIKRLGNNISRDRMYFKNISFKLSENEPISCDYISMKALISLLGSSYLNKIDIRDSTKTLIQVEVIKMLSLFGQRLGLSPLE